MTFRTVETYRSGFGDKKPNQTQTKYCHLFVFQEISLCSFFIFSPPFFAWLHCKQNFALQEYSNPTMTFGDFTAQMQIGFK